MVQCMQVLSIVQQNKGNGTTNFKSFYTIILFLHCAPFYCIGLLHLYCAFAIVFVLHLLSTFVFVLCFYLYFYCVCVCIVLCFVSAFVSCFVSALYLLCALLCVLFCTCNCFALLILVQDLLLIFSGIEDSLVPRLVEKPPSHNTVDGQRFQI